MKKISELWEKWCVRGINLPFAHDATTGKSSVTLLMVYISFVLATVSLILLHIWPQVILGATYSIIFWVLAVIFYQIRRLQKAKFDIDDKSFELEGVDSDK